MRISAIGTGYLGATHAACLAAWGPDVVGVDTDAHLTAVLAGGSAPSHEPGPDTEWEDCRALDPVAAGRV
jgi:UDPglucose 6-dehydrogenase